MRARRLVVEGLVVVLAGAPLVACRASTPDEVSCARAPDDIVEMISTKLEPGMRLRNGNLRDAAVDGYGNGLTYVSAEMLRSDDDDDTLGDILTWATGSVESGDFFSVDVYARDHSSWPHAPFDVTHDGAVESRGCVSFWAGEPPEVRETNEGSSEGLEDLGFESDETTTTTARPQ